MYNICKLTDHLLVEFQDNFDYSTIKGIIHHETMMKEYPYTNDIWLIGSHHADIRLGELENMVKDFQCRCPIDATRTKTALVAKQGLTQVILEIWMNAVQKKVTFELRMFNNLDDAKVWLKIAQPQVA
ncbi:MAG: hypothetical protein V3V05_13110 [Pontiella sp.]